MPMSLSLPLCGDKPMSGIREDLAVVCSNGKVHKNKPVYLKLSKNCCSGFYAVSPQISLWIRF